jgi:hypothetical protein
MAIQFTHRAFVMPPESDDMSKAIESAARPFGSDCRISSRPARVFS